MSAVRHALARDLPELARTLASAFAEDPVTNWMFEDPATRPAHLLRMQAFVLETGLPHGHLYTDPSLRSAAIWSPPDVALLDDERGAALAQLMTESIGERAGEKLAAMAQLAGAHPKDPHFYLFTLGTRADAQSQGLGSLVIEPVLARCDADGLPAYLESSNPRNVPFYERHGFRVTSELLLAENGPLMHTMWREPSAPR